MVALCLLAADVAPCNGQAWTVGLRGGINASRMAFQDRTAQSLVKATPGFHVGALAGLRVKGLLEWYAEVLYTRKGFDSDDEKLQLAYVEVPLLLSLHWPGALSPRLFAGPVVSFEVGCKSTRVPGLGEVGCDHALATVARRKTDIGLSVGGGIAFKASPGSIFLDLWIN